MTHHPTSPSVAREDADARRDGAEGRVGRTATRRQAAWILGTAVLAAVVGVGAGSAPVRVVEPHRSDIVAFREVVRRVRQGEPYYSAMAGELRTRGYPMQSAFNWRTPLHLTFVALMTDEQARVILVALCLVSALALWLATPAQAVIRTASGVMAVGTVLVTAAPDLVFLPEAWAGVLIAGSAGALARHRIGWGVGSALAALALRELAAPYCVACTVMAAADRDWPQVRLWLLGAAGYAVYYGFHVAGIETVRHTGDLAQTASWVSFGGVPAVLTAMRWTSWWFLASTAAAPLLLALVVAGVAASNTPRHARAAAAVYLGFLLIAGQPFNHYWGLLAAPLWAFAAGCGVVALGAASGQLRRAATRRIGQ
jgi:hypothetical protein